ncbi:MAG TPA: LysM domain-containing protein, partial [Longimicrobium sp.]|nr:LysM domain-containing protein [Longimicrobium sp.]
RPASASSNSTTASAARRSEGTRGGSSSSTSASGRTHTVEDGETLWGIARRYDLTVAQVREANELSESAQIQPGQKLRIPRASSSASSSASTRVASRDEERPAARRSSESERSTSRSESRSTGRRRVAEHTVKSGETLWSIARTYDSSVEAIRDANAMDADSVLQPGQKLRVPRPASSGARD